eukprot:g4963.t1
MAYANHGTAPPLAHELTHSEAGFANPLAAGDQNISSPVMGPYPVPASAPPAPPGSFADARGPPPVHHPRNSLTGVSYVAAHQPLQPPGTPPSHAADAELARRLQQEEQARARNAQLARQQQQQQQHRSAAGMPAAAGGGHYGSAYEGADLKQEPAMKQKTAYFTNTVAVACVGVFVYSIYLNGWGFAPTDVNPLFGPSNCVLYDMGALFERSLVDHGQWWRLWAPMVLHVGVIHLLFNLMSFLRTGSDLECAFGTWRIAVLFVVSGVLSSVASAIFLPEIMSVGASGAIFGLLGAQLSDFIQNYSQFQDKASTACSLAFSCIINLAIGAIIPQLNNFAHVGGFITGVLLGLVLLIEKSTDRRGVTRAPRAHQTIIQFVAAALLLVGTACGFFILYNKTGGAWCAWCNRINCIPELGFDCAVIGADPITFCAGAGGTTAAPGRPTFLP